MMAKAIGGNQPTSLDGQQGEFSNKDRSMKSAPGDGLQLASEASRRLRVGEFSLDCVENRHCLQNWLQGFSLPLTLGRSEPFEFVWDELEKLEDTDEPCGRSNIKKKLAVQLRLLFERHYDGLITSSQIEEPKSECVPLPDCVRLPEALIYNALNLAARLSCPEELGEELRDLYDRDRSRENPKLTNDLRSSLLSALIANQSDLTLKSVWVDLIQYGQTGDGYFFGHPIDGWTGILAANLAANSDQIIISITSRGYRFAGTAFRRFGERIYNDPRRRERLREVFDRIEFQSAGWDQDTIWIQVADEGNWPDWMLESLPNLFTSRKVGNQIVHLVWNQIFTCFPQSSSSLFQRERCQGQVIEFTLDHTQIEDLDQLQDIATAFETARRDHLEPSGSSMSGMVGEVILQLEERAITAKNIAEAQRYKQCRNRHLRSCFPMNR